MRNTGKGPHPGRGRSGTIPGGVERGVIQAMEILTPSVGRNVSELIRQVQAFRHVAKTGEVMPSGWQPGKPTLKPGPELVGKVWKEWKPDMAF